jgi:Multicopper oxidase
MKLQSFVLFFFLFLCVNSAFAKVRHYYIAAEDCVWDFAPSGRNLIEGGPIPLPWGQQTRWPKTRYIGYTDATFTKRTPQPEWLGILGPIIRAEVGDEIIVDFLNRGYQPYSMHPHGLHYDKNDEGARYIPGGLGGQVLPGHHFIYHWYADADSGPGPGQPSSIVWWYHSHVNPGVEVNEGLLGPIIVTAKGKALPDGRPKDVDKEFVTLFMIFDQLNGKPNGLFYSINGYIFGNLPGLEMKKGDRVRWYLLGMGNEIDIHTPHWHGETVMYGNRRTDVVELLPGSMKTVDMVADNPGVWLFHCHVSEHMESGMMATYTIYEPQKRLCPVKFTAGNFYGGSGDHTLTVQNTSGKAIKQLVISFDHFIAPQYLHQPFDHTWIASSPLAPGAKETLTRKPYLGGAEHSILGWALFPYAITYGDGTTWSPQHTGECFQMYWRDKDHPDLHVLPPRQLELPEENE